MSDGESRPPGEANHGPSATPPAVRRMRAATTAGILVVLALLAVFAYLLAGARRQAREDVEHRFRDVAHVSAALTDGIFAFSQGSTTQQATAQLGARRVDPRRLEALARRGRAPYLELYDDRGRRIAATRRAPRDSAPSAEVLGALRTGRARLSNVMGQGRAGLVEWAIPYRGAAGVRVYLATIPLTNLGEFLAGFLSRVPNFADARSDVVDGRGVVLGGSELRMPLGRPLPDGALLRALRNHTRGEYDGDRYFASAPIANSRWRVAIATDDSDLYDSVDGSRGTIPWLLFAAFAVAALAGLLFMRRSALAAAELQRRELNERHAVEINDNIIQGLALASYQLQRGEEREGAAQLAETLREAQRLVSQLLGDGEVVPGSLRRDSAARTGPAPPEERDAT